MTYDSYPPGMSHSDLIHVGEISDPYEQFYEDYEATDDQLETWFENEPKTALKAIREQWNEYDLQEGWKNDNNDVIETEYDRRD